MPTCAHVVVGVSLQVCERVQGGGAVDGGGGQLDRGGGGGGQRELEPARVLHGRRHFRLEPDCHLMSYVMPAQIPNRLSPPCHPLRHWRAGGSEKLAAPM